MEGILITVDPGCVLGVAVFRNSVLLDVGLLSAPTIRDLHFRLHQLFSKYSPRHAVVEVPQVYQQRRWKGDPNDLIDVAVLAGIAGAALAPFCEPLFITPHVWKGNRPKSVDNEYTLSKLSAVEREIVDRCSWPKAQAHNVLDALGIGLWSLERR